MNKKETSNADCLQRLVRPLVQSKLIQAGVKNLVQFGYPSCNEKNILTDQIFKAFFVSMLRDNLGKGYDSDIKALLKECGEVA